MLPLADVLRSWRSAVGQCHDRWCRNRRHQLIGAALTSLWLSFSIMFRLAAFFSLIYMLVLSTYLTFISKRFFYPVCVLIYVYDGTVCITALHLKITALPGRELQQLKFLFYQEAIQQGYCPYDLKYIVL